MEARDQGWRRLATKVTRRRSQLGLTQGGVQAAGGPSVATMRLIEGALQSGYRGTILGRLERALDWQPGSVEAILDGGEPKETEPAASASAPDVRRYTDPATGEEYTHPDEQEIWSSGLTEQDRRELILYLRARRAARDAEDRQRRRPPGRDAA